MKFMWARPLDFMWSNLSYFGEENRDWQPVVVASDLVFIIGTSAIYPFEWFEFKEMETPPTA